jgi:hypothetical protein
LSFTMAALRARPGKVLLLAEEKSGSYIAGVEKPAKGWTAYVAELTYPEMAPLRSNSPLKCASYPTSCRTPLAKPAA